MLKVQVLGQPAEDNALLVTADSGNGLTRLLLDCGAGTLNQVPFAELQSIDHLLFSHLHMDHVGGFDAFFRANFERDSRENHIWGPPETARIMAHRLQGYWWNFAPDLRGTWLVHDVSEGEIQTFRFEAHEAFAVMHDEGTQDHAGLILQTPQISVQALMLKHHGPSLGYLLREPTRLKVNTAALAESGLKGGLWLAQLKAGATGALDIAGVLHDAAALRAQLLYMEQGKSAAYLTDFLLDESELARLAPLLRDIQTLYAEAQYAPADAELAHKHQHTTVEQVATLAKAAEVQRLVLLHLSRRYRAQQWGEMVQAAQHIFPATSFPHGWLG